MYQYHNETFNEHNFDYAALQDGEINGCTFERCPFGELLWKR